MNNEITVYGVTYLIPPFSGTVCDVYGNQCQYIGSGTTFPITFTLPIEFQTAPAAQLVITDSNGCSISEILNCTS